ncbi:MAG: transposase [Pseudomonadota bacterium]
MGFSEEQIMGILKEHQAGLSAAEISRRHGISSATFYAWCRKYSGMDASEAKRLRELETENAKFKRIVADQMLDMSSMKELLAKNVWSGPRLQGAW